MTHNLLGGDRVADYRSFWITASHTIFLTVPAARRQVAGQQARRWCCCGSCQGRPVLAGAIVE